MAEIAKALDRPPSYTTKYFGFELGALTTIDHEKDRYIVNGKHDQATLAKTLDNFIEKFVLCKKCDRFVYILHVCLSFLFSKQQKRAFFALFVDFNIIIWLKFQWNVTQMKFTLARSAIGLLKKSLFWVTI